MSELVPTIAFSPSAMSRASSTASISPRAHSLVVTGIVDFLPYWYIILLVRPNKRHFSR
jgi:hypothetical protein